MDNFLDNLIPYQGNEGLEAKDLIFRNYIPKNDSLKEFIVHAPTTVAETELEIERDIKQSVREFNMQQEEPLTIIPQKPNMDLKKSLDRKLNVLNKKTEAAIIQLLKNKLSEKNK
ncbi:unnamed protein product [Blepharisma stoltei]|uniref:Uncharacterized protein n=1 Tax=Blepharisma stoltei TaxID=1481888 RepID=A0AAU9JPU6_9CILI|nr:unnamed protein product [Blepharisma stoltei]